MKMLTICGALIASLLISSHTFAESRPFSVADSIRMERFNDQSLDGLGSSTLFNDSPDGKYSVILTSKGLIESDKIQSSLWLVNYQNVRTALELPRLMGAPRLSRIASVAASPTGNAHGTGTYVSVISGVKWSNDSRSLYFLGENSHGNRQLYRAFVHSRDIRTLTPEDRDVESFDTAGSMILYRASRSTQSESGTTPGARSRQTVSVVTGMPIVDIMAGANSNRLRSYDLWSLRNGRNRLILKVAPSEQGSSAGLALPLTISPDSRFAVLPLTPDSIPVSWERYETPPQFDYLKLNHLDLRPISPYSEGNLPREYTLVDLKKHTTTKLGLDGFYLNSIGVRSAQWSGDSRRVLISNTFLPIQESGHQAANRVHPCEAAVFDLAAGASQCLIFGASVSQAPPGAHLQSAAFNLDGTRVNLRYGSFNSTDSVTVVFAYSDHQWKIVPSSPDPITNTDLGQIAQIALFVKETPNERPTLWAKDLTTKSETKVWDPNPDFDRLEISYASEYRWTDRYGHPWSGGLFLPIDYDKRHRYPLVIQTHGFAPSQFAVDGAYPTAMAVRALNSAGIMVLQLFSSGGDPNHLSTNDEAADAVQGFESAIDALDSGGMIDPKKVGIIGFSRTCWYVENALVKLPGRFAAASVADGVSYSYTQYLLFGPSSTLMERNYVQVIGAAPIAEGLNQWIRYSPEFHTDQIFAPLRIEAIQSGSILQEWELYASLRLQKKPVDLIYFPGGQHILQRPSERFASEQGNVDWFRFWLQGYEDPAPQKNDQYERWRTMRESRNQSRVQAGMPTSNSKR
jgi:hypothetical protein